MAWALLLALLAAGPSAVNGRATLRAAAGAEVDTNARRAVPLVAGEPPSEANSRPTEVVQDGLVRAQIELSSGVNLADAHVFSSVLRVGAKRFFVESSEDVIALDLDLTSRHRLATNWVLGSFVGGRVNRIRSGRRDYSSLVGGVELQLRTGAFDLSVRSYGTGFSFGQEPRFNFSGPAVGAELGWKPAARWRLSVRVAHEWRFYAGNGLVVAVPNAESPAGVVPQITFCERPEEKAREGLSCMSQPRRDREWLGGTMLRYQGDFIFEAQYAYGRQRSSSDLESVDRHRLTLLTTFPLPWRLTASLRGALQINDGVSQTEGQLLAEDDENQNALQAQLLRELNSWVDLEIRYSLFANQFSTIETSFFRQTVYLGITTRSNLK